MHARLASSSDPACTGGAEDAGSSRVSPHPPMPGVVGFCCAPLFSGYADVCVCVCLKAPWLFFMSRARRHKVWLADRRNYMHSVSRRASGSAKLLAGPLCRAVQRPPGPDTCASKSAGIQKSRKRFYVVGSSNTASRPPSLSSARPVLGVCGGCGPSSQ